jgi:aminopeptidase N
MTIGRSVFFASTTSLLALILSAAPALSANKAKTLQKITVTSQLPRNATPEHYGITLTPDAANLKFRAQTAIVINLTTASKSITLNAADLAFESVVIISNAGKKTPLTVSINAEKQTATFTAPTLLPVGRYTIDTKYSGTIYQQANGLFALDYKDTKGAEKRALFTQFEAPDARRMFPSWDEPNYKATFSLNVIVPKDLMAVSNMPIAQQGPIDNDKVAISFAETPKMSTYLLFFGLGEFDRIAKKVGPTEVGVIVGRGNGEKGRYALEASAQIVNFYNDYFGVPYPLPKLDNVAGPGQSQFFSAMENWGAIFTFERVLLVDPKITSARAKQRIYQTDAHEIAHQWFGNLVTMQWWDDLWLNEGFASWMETKTTAHFNPTWMAELDRVDGRESAMNLDAFVTTHPVIQNIKTVEQTTQAFDTITYQKGEAVITMLEGFAGADVWRTGIRAYMKKHAYGNTSTNDLWTAVEKAGAKGLSTIAHDFTKKPGIPLIKVSSAACVNGTTQIALQQGEFSRDRKSQTDAKPLVWNVPVIAQTIGGAPVRTVISNGKGRMSVPGCGTLMVNAGQTGYYRVLYTPELSAALNKDFAKLSPIDQLGLLNDSLRLAYGDYQSIGMALDLYAAVPTTASQRIIEDTVDTHGALYDRFRNDDASQARIANLTDNRFGPALQKLGMKPIEGEPLLDSNLRSTLISTLGTMGNATVVAEANRLFAALDQDKSALDGPLRSTWLSVVAYNADKTTWDKLRTLGKTADSQVVKATMYSLLGRTKNKELAMDALKLALTPEPGPTTSAGIISSVAGQHPDMAVDFALANLKAVENLVDVSSRSEYVGNLAGSSRDPAMPAKLDAYAKTYLTPESRKTVDQTIASIKTRLATEPRIKAGITEWLGRQK